MRLIDVDAAIEAVEKSMFKNPHKDKIHRSMHDHEHRHFLTILMGLPSIQPEIKIDEDIISRQQAIEALETVKTVKAENGELYIAKINAQMKLEILPSAQPKHRIGHWEGNQPNGRYRCSECGCLSISNDDNFCFNCGADMRGEEK